MMAFISHRLYDMSWHAPLILGLGDFPIRISNRDKLWNAWNRRLGNSTVDTGILLNNTKFHLMNSKRHFEAWPFSVTPAIDQTLHQFMVSLPNSVFYRIMRGSQRALIFVTDVACQQGTITHPDTWSHWRLTYALLVETKFAPNLS